MSRWLNNYSFHLPPDRIAQSPTRLRDQARLLVLDRKTGRVKDSSFSRLPLLLGKGDLLVLNDSAVLPARIIGRKMDTGGGRVELLLLESKGDGRWRALMKGRGRHGARIEFDFPGITGIITGIDDGGEVTVSFNPPGGAEVLMAKKGRPPLPPYIRRPAETPPGVLRSDRSRYQTIFASCEGSVAAPTAGLHFTRRILRGLEKRGVETAFLTLHVGPGTFRPLRHNDLTLARLESEKAFVPSKTAMAFNKARERGGRIVAVGTTVTRALESFIGGDGRLRGGRKKVDLLIRPGFRFRAVDALITNFHLPASSLLLLVCGFAGRKKVLDVYRQAVVGGYRFYSYGDAMLII